MNEHRIYCDNNTCTKIVLPKPYDNITQFKNYNNSLKVPFTIYSDFEVYTQNQHKLQMELLMVYYNS